MKFERFLLQPTQIDQAHCTPVVLPQLVSDTGLRYITRGNGERRTEETTEECEYVLSFGWLPSPNHGWLAGSGKFLLDLASTFNLDSGSRGICNFIVLSCDSGSRATPLSLTADWHTHVCIRNGKRRSEVFSCICKLVPKRGARHSVEMFEI